MRNLFLILATIIFLLLITLSPLGCAKDKTLKMKKIVQSYMEEKKKQGNLGEAGKVESWYIRDASLDEINQQAFVYADLITTNYAFLLSFDIRKRNGHWSIYYVKVEDKINLYEVDNPSKYWLRRLYFSIPFSCPR